MAAVRAQPQLIFTPFIQNLTKPLEIKNAGDSSNRLFIVEQSGLIKIYKNGKVLKSPFLDLSNKISIDTFKGLWSVAFPPNYRSTGKFFVYYIDRNDAIVLARYQVSKTKPDSALPNSGVVLFTLPGIGTGGAKLGELQFGKDGYLYVSISDGSYYDRTTNFAQDGTVLFGKMLRLNINVNHPPYYSIPPDNPYVNDSTIRDEIWDFGFRNAWRWSFDNLNGNMWIGDTGADRWDEVDFKKSSKTGAVNFGWPCYEANQPFITNGCLPKSNYTFPVFSYPHDNKVGNAIIGGYVYRGASYPNLNGYYICSDFYSLNAWKIIPNGLGGWNVYEQNGIPEGIAGYGEGEDKELYAVSLNGIVYKVGTTATFTNSQLMPIPQFINGTTIDATTESPLH